MNVMKRMTVTVTPEQADMVKSAVEKGLYASDSEVIRDALREWELTQAHRDQVLAALRGEIDKGLADMSAGRVRSFDAEAIIKQGKKRLAARRSRSA
ncbi:MAG: antitoxin ParD1/3/4 [Alphaproteobacteria bacterium]|jgi:antitoxin ParD1/3/4|nr:antitoxin ParD1/3/4 [Alphaproteobacteria bacterium]